MASTYTTNLGIEKIGTGEQSGTWGNTTNTNLDILDEAISGILTVTLSSAGSSGSPTALPITDGSSSNGRNKYINFADGGDLGGTAYVQLTPNNAEKIVFMRNSLSSSRSIIVFQGTYNASNDFEIPNGKDVALKFDGGGSGATVTLLQPDEMRTGSFTVDNLNIDGNTIISTDSNGNIALTPNGTGEVDISKVDIDSGAIDGTTIGASSAAAGTFAALGTSGITCSGNITVADAGTIGSASDTDAIAIGSDGDVTLTQDLELQHDGAILSFGANDEITLTHVHDEGLTLKNTLTTDSTPAVLNLNTGETTVSADDILAKIRVFAPDESAGSDAVLNAAEIRVTADANFAADSNATNMRFYTGKSEDAGATATDPGLEISSEQNVYAGAAARYHTETNPSSTPAQGFLNVPFGPQFQNGITIAANSADNSTARKALELYTNDGTARGNIAMNGSNGVTTFNTSSDYRLKENITNITDGITSVKKLAPKRFSWKNSSASDLYEGFLAHEVSDAVPNAKAVDGTKDAVVNGKAVYQGMDYSKLVPILTAALQEAIAKIETLETKVAVLESK